MIEIAAAIVIVGAMVTASLYRLGQQYLRTLEEPEAEAPLPLPREAEAGEEGDEDTDVLGFIRYGMDSIVAQQFEEWIQERRDDGLTDKEIQDALRNREPVIII